VAACSDGSLVGCDANTGNAKYRLNLGPATIVALEFTPDATQLMVQCLDRVVMVDAQSGEILETFAPELERPVRVFAGRSAHQFATIDGQGQLALWQGGAEPRLLGRIRGRQTELVRRAFFSPNGAWLCNAGDFGSSRVWNTRTAEEAFTIVGRVHGAQFDPESKFLVTVGGENWATLWDLGTGHELKRFQGHTKVMDSFAFTSDGRRLVSGSQDGVIKLWNTAPGREVLHERTWMWGTSISPDGKTIAGQPSYRGLILWDVESGRRRLTIHMPGESIYTTAFSPDGRYIASGGVQQVVRLWDAATGGRVRTFIGHTQPVFSLAFSPDGTRLVTGGLDGTTRVWAVDSGEALHQLTAEGEAVFSVDFSPDGSKILSAGMDGTPRIWDLYSGQLSTSLHGHSGWIWSARFFHQSQQVVSWGTDFTARVSDWHSGRELLRWPVRGTSLGIASSDDARLFTFSSRTPIYGIEFPTLEVWQPNVGLELLRLQDHLDPIVNVAFHPETRRLVTGSLDGTIRVREAFPWRAEDYPTAGDCEAGGSTAAHTSALMEDENRPWLTRVRTHARNYWQQRLAVEDRAWAEGGSAERVVHATFEPELLPPRDGAASVAQIDLSGFYTSPFRLPFQPVLRFLQNQYWLSRLPVGLVTIEGITFDARGVVQLRKSESQGGMFAAVWEQWPDRVDGIPVRQRFQRLHLLHGTSGREPDGTCIAALVFHYAEDPPVEINLCYGVHVRDWFYRPDEASLPATPGTRAIWTDTNPVAEAQGQLVRLFLATLPNPRPDQEVTAIDYVSRMTQCAPFLVALTVD
jgi:WD40 repeat protein